MAHPTYWGRPPVGVAFVLSCCVFLSWFCVCLGTNFASAKPKGVRVTPRGVILA